MSATAYHHDAGPWFVQVYTEVLGGVTVCHSGIEALNAFSVPSDGSRRGPVAF
jgi:hypothetical protein